MIVLKYMSLICVLTSSPSIIMRLSTPSELMSLARILIRDLAESRVKNLRYFMDSRMFMIVSQGLATVSCRVLRILRHHRSLLT